MREFVIMTDSCCDLTAEMAHELNVMVQPLSLLLDDKSYCNYLDGREIGFKEFYDYMRAGKLGSTSAVSVGQFEDAMRHVLAEGKDILYIGFSSGLSTTYQSAAIAAESLREEFPDAEIRTVDSLCASMGQGLLIWLCAQQKKAGKTLAEVYDYCVETRLHLCHWFTVNDLNHLKRGGRVSATTALVGTMLSIKPVLHVDDEGHLINVGKVRGRKAAIKALADKIGELGAGYDNSTVFISHGDCADEARSLADIVKEKYGIQTVVIGYVGAVIGSHSGPGTIALFFLGDHR